MLNKRNIALDYIIENKQIRTVFQPIISLKDGSVLGHEALSRITCKSDIENPEMLFGIAGEYNRLWDLELLCRTTALEAAFQFMIPPYNKMLFINVNPNTMHDENFIKGFTREFLMQYQIEPQNIIFEITERNVILDMSGFLSTINHYRSQNYKIAIDDAGAGYSGLNLISEVNPNYIKLDMKLIRNIHTDNLKYALVKGMVELSRASNINLIAEGIETKEEFTTLIDLGVQYGQGYYIQKPASEIYEPSDEVLQQINHINMKNNQISGFSIACTDIKNICSYTGIVSPKVSSNYVYNIFKQNPNFFGLCIVEDEIPLGIITYEKLALKMSGHYGFSLYQNKPISELMDRNFLHVDHQIPISKVSYLAMSRTLDHLYDFIVVTEKGKYIGTVTIKDLLQKTTEIEVDHAKHQNPLSGLPGNHIVEQKLKQCLNWNTDYTVAYIDIDNFKAFNDVYGFESGDLVIKLLSNILKDIVPKENFIGHIGGDDFIVVINEIVSEAYFEEIQNQFELRVLSFYRPTDIQNGYIITVNRRGETEQFPLTTLTTVTINNLTHKCKDVYELTELLAKKKREIKQNKLALFLHK
jgi:EAL domain-containing protein (putative c-di-GMP-specific phosphodiesterase class I)/GGDEF domain-containing protein/CBS domain-containing protein